MLVSLIIMLIVVGVALYLIQLIPMDETIKKVIYIVVLLLVVLYVLRTFGLLTELNKL